MDASELLLIAAALVGMVTAIAHLYGYLPRRYRTALASIQEGVATRIGTEVRKALDASMDRQRALAAEDLAKAQEEMAHAQEELAKKEGNPNLADHDMAVVQGAMARAIGVDKQMQRKVSSLLGEAILGPALPLLRQFAPGLADALEENPQLIDVVVRNPLFIKYVQPRIEQYLGSMGTGASAGTAEAGWGT